MTTIADIDISDLTAFEEDIAKPCSVKGCDTQADWIVLFKHGPYACPSEEYLCTRHKDDVIAIVLKGIRNNHRACGRTPECRKEGRMGGHVVSDYVTPIPLH